MAIELAAIGAGLEAIKSAIGLVQTLGTAKTDTAVNEVKLALQNSLIDAQRAIFAAQATETALSQRIRELEEELTRFETWEAEKQHYQLRDVYRGAFAYVPKPDGARATPPHWLCANCYENRRKSILQASPAPYRCTNHSCPHCNSVVVTPSGIAPGRNQEDPKPTLRSGRAITD